VKDRIGAANVLWFILRWIQVTVLQSKSALRVELEFEYGIQSATVTQLLLSLLIGA